MDPVAVVEEKYHLIVTAGYGLVIGVIILVMRTSPLERVCLWALAIAFFGSVLHRTRKGVEIPPKFEL